MKISLFSFGFKYGPPTDVNALFDVRFLDNPYWELELRPKSGLIQEVAKFVLDNESGDKLIAQLVPLFSLMIEKSIKSQKESISIAIGCTGGRHRSVAVVEKIGRLLVSRFPELYTYHRDIEKDTV